jgi:SOS response regulatory protein OraA/RecX
MALKQRREPKNPKSCHERALGLLAVRPRSRRELERRLLQARFDRLSSLLMRRGYSPDLARRTARKALELSFVDE